MQAQKHKAPSSGGQRLSGSKTKFGLSCCLLAVASLPKPRECAQDVKIQGKDKGLVVFEKRRGSTLGTMMYREEIRNAHYKEQPVPG
ncbi:hypothetical protein HJFPF1_07831 [Paramyrothecium foliicola]|nr:hypothetical protein HJFPF1_07831 [Paramyrothecium foliicola]